MHTLALRVTKEVIDGAVVTRFNGNNPGGGREAAAGHKTVRPRGIYLTKAQKASARRRNAEALYDRRFLDG